MSIWGNSIKRSNTSNVRIEDRPDKVYEIGDTLVMPNGDVLTAVPADTDGAGFYVCDAGMFNPCYFRERGNCPQCHFAKVVFIKK